ncbi:probable protein phosphatase 2C 24 [Diospyros lotus]|uniref:probable protein phosphatase 2C 24 n=1 Tax=Diospyros lotus TaxID=55363 RepID=UPI0022561193|nr:probable protein phosphatase 2C 24 [Diospyros lotus]
MADIGGEVVSKSSKTSEPCRPGSRAARHRRMEIRRFKFVAAMATCESENGLKGQNLDLPTRGEDDAIWSSGSDRGERVLDPETEEVTISDPSSDLLLTPGLIISPPKFGAASICGRRRDMEDAVAIHPSFCRRENETEAEFHYFAVYDGHGCSHVAMKCRDRLHELVKEELENDDASAGTDWKTAMERSFHRMDKEANIAWNGTTVRANCRCELQSPECDAVGSTAVVAIVTPDKIVVANCGDSRAILCRGGKAVPLSADHKPDRPDELNRIEAAGGRVIYWEGPRVLGVLAMSRAIGDNYLKPYVSCEPEVTLTNRTAHDECLILASDGLWDVVSNNTACGVARMCLRRQARSPEGEGGGENADKGCSDASATLTMLALARRSTDNVSVVVVDLRRHT